MRGATARPRFWRFLVLAVILQAVPAIVSASSLLWINLACVYAVAAVGLNVIFGLGGLLSVGQAGVMAVGGYMTILIFGEDVGLVPAVLLACVGGAAASLLIGLVGARVKTHYFVLASLAVAETIVIVINNETELTGGANGMAIKAPPVIAGFNLLDPVHFFHIASVVVLLAAYLADALRASRGGLALSAMTMNEHAAMASGVSPLGVRALATAVGGVLGALGGAMLALLSGYLGPQDFHLATAALLLLIVVVAGRGRNGSVVLAAVLLTWLSQGLLTLQSVGQLVYGMALILLLVFAPEGIYGAAEWMRKGLRSRSGRRTNPRWR